jgi:hypothetical protein
MAPSINTVTPPSILVVMNRRLTASEEEESNKSKGFIPKAMMGTFSATTIRLKSRQRA